MTSRGGALISQGGYGCVYYPSLDCDGNETGNMNYVTKIQNSKEEAENEIRLGNMIQTLSRFENHFSPLMSGCNPISLKQLQPSGVLQHCKLRLGDEYYISQSRFIHGYTLFQYLSTIR